MKRFAGFGVRNVPEQDLAGVSPELVEAVKAAWKRNMTAPERFNTFNETQSGANNNPYRADMAAYLTEFGQVPTAAEMNRMRRPGKFSFNSAGRETLNMLGTMASPAAPWIMDRQYSGKDPRY